MSSSYLGGGGGSGGGKVVNYSYTYSQTAGSGTTQIPLDDTIPQNTEGNEVISAAITPTDSSNVLVITVVLNECSTSQQDRVMIGALFQDSTADAIATVLDYTGDTPTGRAITMRHIMTAGTTSETTFSFRIGQNGSGTIEWNDASYLGDTLGVSMMIEELAV